MPSPVGHALAGAAFALLFEPFTVHRERRALMMSGASAVLPTAPSWRGAPLTIEGRRLFLVCMVLAALPDADLLYQPSHRAFTHSVGSALIVMVVVMAMVNVRALAIALATLTSIFTRLVTGQVTPGPAVIGSAAPMTDHVAGACRWAIVCGAAWASHMVLDWMGADPNPPHGVQALWPFSDRWFISGWDVFRGTERRNIFTLESLLYNARAVLWEILLLGPVVLALALRRVRRTT
jgi:membrane-bound metal-dependent hydrolase YbcI (DUF457 family)